MNRITLFELNRLVRRTIDSNFNQTYWLQAELSEVRESRGHCYVEFVQKEEQGNTLVAKARGQVWANTWNILRPHFENATGQQLKAGMQVLVKVRVTFHEAYGLSLNIVDIDPTYTLGDLARRRREILLQLEREGVLNMNKELALPRLLQRIAVISSATAAGYEDFSRQLEANPYRLRFLTRLFPATMQGEAVEATVISALNQIARQQDQWDAVVIIRGGGSATDLSGFDTLALAENVAQFPLPVITGIGHERDDTVIDLVSHTRVKTPTAAAEFILQHQKTELDHLEAMADQLCRQIQSNLFMLHTTLSTLYASLSTASRARLTTLQTSLTTLHTALATATRFALQKSRSKLDLATAQIDSASPERLLRLGYSITRANGKVVTRASEVPPDTVLTTTLADGTLQSVSVESLKNKTMR